MKKVHFFCQNRSHISTTALYSGEALKKQKLASVLIILWKGWSRWKRLIMVNSMQANEAPQERMSAALR